MRVSSTALLLLCASSASAFSPSSGATNTLSKVAIEGGYVIQEKRPPTKAWTPSLKGDGKQRPKWLVSSSTKAPPSPVIAAAKKNAQERSESIARDAEMAVKVKSRVAMLRERARLVQQQRGQKQTESSPVELKQNTPEVSAPVATAEVPAAPKANVPETTTLTKAAAAAPLSSSKAGPLPQQALRADPREPNGWWGPKPSVKGTYQLPIRVVAPDALAATARPKTNEPVNKRVQYKKDFVVSAKTATPPASTPTPTATAAPVKKVESVKTVEPKPSTKAFAKKKTPVDSMPVEKATPKPVKAVEAKPISGSGFFDKKVSMDSSLKAAEAKRKAEDSTFAKSVTTPTASTPAGKVQSTTAISMATDPYAEMDWPERY